MNTRDCAAIYREPDCIATSEADLADPWLDHMVIDYDDDHRWIVMHVADCGRPAIWRRAVSSRSPARWCCAPLRPASALRRPRWSRISFAILRLWITDYPRRGDRRMIAG